MTAHHRNQLVILLGTILLSLLVLFPTFAPWMLGADYKTPEWWPTRRIKLGLDLRGGTYLVLGVQTREAVKSQLNSIAGAIKNDMRKDRIGVLRSRAAGERGIQITLLNDKGLDQLEAYISKNFPQLTKTTSTAAEGGRVNVEYAMSEMEAREIERASVDQAIVTIRNRVDQYGVAEPTIQRSGEKRIMVQLPDVTNLDNVKKMIGSVAKLEFRLVADPSKPVAETITVSERGGGSLTVEDEVLMTGDTIDTARVDPDPQTNEIGVSLSLNSIGAQVFDRITSENVNRRLAVILDGVSQVAPNINERISGGQARITGNYNTEEATRLAIVLRSGALPAPLTFEEQRTVGASLGQDSIHKGVMASLVGAILVIVFMIAYYRKSGVLAIACLAINMLWLLSLIALFGSTLTLPGIAGLALTVGMAVDSNIIIFERIREELRLGATPKAAVDTAFMRAHWTVLDANITTLISGIILYGFGTGPIKGYAVTLSIGIITTVAAALFASRLGFSLFRLRDAKDSLSI